MKKIVLTFLLSISVFLPSLANGSLKGKVLDLSTKSALPFVYVQLLNSKNKITYTDSEGNFEFNSLSPGTYTITYACIGYRIKTDTVQVMDKELMSLVVFLQEDLVEIPEVAIAARKEFSQSTLNSLDFKLRTHNTTQDLLRLVPGLFIAQHAGGGKAEQLFLRGFDVDHGTDVAITVDGLPVNMVSHAHGQGYADLHFVIPETVDNLSFSKGAYDARTGDLNTAGAVRFQTKNILTKNSIKYEIGRFGMNRGLLMLNLIKNNDSTKNRHSAYLAAEFFHTRGFFVLPQNFNRYNVFGKYNLNFSKNTNLTLSVSAFKSKWLSSGQIPQRAVDENIISRYGAIDSSEGGNTSRRNIVAIVTSTLENNAVLKNQFYFTNYSFDLYSNFTFFKEDSINGDEIRQFERRNMYGYNGSYGKNIEIWGVIVKVMAGIGFRADRINNIGLTHTLKRRSLNEIKRGSINENNLNGFCDLNFLLSEKFSLNIGLRYDYFTFKYLSKLKDTTYSLVNKGLFSPKINLYYKSGKNIQFYFSSGFGFHSNDARVAVQSVQNSIPRSFGMDLGSNFKIRRKIFVNASLWYIFLESEFIYGGDDGLIGPSGRTRRIGIDFSARYQILQWMFIDADLNLAKPRFIDLPAGLNYVTLAPTFTSTGGIGINNKKGLSGSIRHRYLRKRPAVEDNSLIATGYFIMDAVLNYQRKNYQISLSVENLLNRKWKEAQFGIQSRLKTEPEALTGINFTPGTPRFIKLGFAFLF